MRTTMRRAVGGTETVTATDTVAFFAEALTLTRRRQDLAPLVERTIERLHSEGARAYAGQVERHGWRSLPVVGPVWKSSVSHLGCPMCPNFP